MTIEQKIDLLAAALFLVGGCLFVARQLSILVYFGTVFIACGLLVIAEFS